MGAPTPSTRVASSPTAAPSISWAPPTNFNPRPLTGTDRLKTSNQWSSWFRQVGGAAIGIGGSATVVLKGTPRPLDVADTAIWDQVDAALRFFILLSVEPSINYLLAGTTTAHTCILALRSHFAPSDTQGVVACLTRLFAGIRISSGSLSSVDAFIKEYQETQSTLAQSQLELGAIQSAAHILSLMEAAPLFCVLRTSILVKAGTGLDLPLPEELSQLLRSEAKQEPSATGHLASSLLSKLRTNSRACQVPSCGGFHWNRDCPHPNRDKFLNDQRKKRQGKEANIAVTSLTPASTAPVTPSPSAALSTPLGNNYSDGVSGWLSVGLTVMRGEYKVDTGASHHMSGERNHFVLLTPCIPKSIRGIGEQLYASGVGKISFRTKTGGKIVMDKVLYVEGISSNLISVSRLTKKGFTLQFGCQATISKDDKLIATASLQSDGLYTLDANVVVPSASASLASIVSSPPVSLTTWHRRFTHLSKLSIQKLAREGHVNGLSLSSSGSNEHVCNACQSGKAKRLPFPPLSKRAACPLKLVHTDLVEIRTTSLGGKSYVLTITDDFSRKSWVYLLGKKSETFDNFKVWFASVKRESGLKLLRICLDNGGEYISKAFLSFLANAGIRHDFTQPHTSQHNARAERYHQTLGHGTITLLEDSGLPAKFWGEAMHTFVFTKNRLPHHTLNSMVPQQLWCGSPPDVSFPPRVWLPRLAHSPPSRTQKT